MCQLHFLRLLADHNKQHNSQENPGGDQHFAVRQPLLENEGQYGHHSCQHHTQQSAF